MLRVKWEGTKSDWTKYNPEWLRFNCQCSQCRQPKSNQRILDVSLIPDRVALDSASLEDERIHVRWKCPEHVGYISVDRLRETADYVSQPSVCSRKTIPELCQSSVTISSETVIDYHDLVDQTARADAICLLYRMLLQNGSAIISEMPTVSGTVKTFVETVLQLPVQRTIYGEVFDVISTPDPINVAYSDAELKPHIDLAYYESPPGLQLLHSLRFDDMVKGGESVLVDGFFAAEELRRVRPEYFRLLSTVPVTFEKIHYDRKWPVHMTYRRPHIAVNGAQQITALFWAPQFEGPLFAPLEQMSAYYEAYKTFSKLIDTCSSRREFRLAPGQMIIFNNRRMLHGRKAFNDGGEGSRHFQGCYVNIDEFKSQALVTLMQHNKYPSVLPHVGNQSC
ncbi:putative gamma-butyrobetaine dioxygenase [Hypsibius exemplaris]|uniref:Gamma-butyrobetaine dioxygenase n=1 Tax=Hypsibius exemplaris TaxID=2072580 RepID=A0A1W0XCU5_HYPEX|nr:putative gamma-butyrobetaine dioxygenase [Hypsibius exemplaris]